MRVFELTPREHEVLALIADGLSNKAIREELHISPKTLERHICHIFSKLGLDAGDGAYNPRVCAVLSWRQARISAVH
jgi:DNA-binding NarL/FixJ family response regulator